MAKALRQQQLLTLMKKAQEAMSELAEELAGEELTQEQYNELQEATKDDCYLQELLNESVEVED